MLAGFLSMAVGSMVLLCGAGSSAIIKNLLPQGTMQGDLNAGGHNITNAATVSAVSVVVSGSLTPPSGFTLPFSALTSTPTTFSGYGLTTPLLPANNLSDLGSPAPARTNLGLGSLATLSPGAGVATQLAVGLPRLGADTNWAALSASTGAFNGQLGIARDGTTGLWNGTNWSAAQLVLENGVNCIGQSYFGNLQVTGSLSGSAFGTNVPGAMGNTLNGPSGLVAFNSGGQLYVEPSGGTYHDNALYIGNLTTSGSIGSNGYAASVVLDRYSGSNGYAAITILGDQTIPGGSGYDHDWGMVMSYPTVASNGSNIDNEPDLSFGDDVGGASGATPGEHHMMDFVFYDPATVKTTATTTSGSATMTVTGSTTGLSAISGGRVYGPGVAAPTTFTISGSTVTLGSNAMQTTTSNHSGTGEYYVFSPATPTPPHKWYLRPWNASNLRPPPALEMNASGQVGVGDGSSAEATFTGSSKFSTPSFAVGGFTFAPTVNFAGALPLMTNANYATMTGSSGASSNQWCFSNDGCIGWWNGSAWSGSINLSHGTTYISFANAMVKSDGSQGLVAATKGADYAAPTVMTANATGTITFNTSGNSETIYNTSSTTIASATITFPSGASSSTPGQTLTYVGHGAITSLSFGGGSIDNRGTLPSSLAADATLVFREVGTNGHYVQVQ